MNKIMRYTILDERLEPYLSDLERDLKSYRNMKNQIIGYQQSSDMMDLNHRTFFASLSPLKLTYFHVYLAFYLSYLNVSGAKKIFLLNQTHVTRAHKWKKYLPVEGERKFKELLDLLKVPSEDYEFLQFDNMSLKLAKNEDYERYIHELNIPEITRIIDNISKKDNIEYNCSFIELKSFVDDCFFTSSIINNVDYVIGSLDRVPIYEYCFDKLEKMGFRTPSIIPLARLPTFHSPGINGGYPSVEEWDSVKKIIELSDCQPEDIFRTIYLFVDLFEHVTKIELESYSKFRYDNSEIISCKDIGEIIQEAFYYLNEEVKEKPEEVKYEATPVIFKVLRNPLRYDILKILFEEETEVEYSVLKDKVSEIHPKLDSSTIYRAVSDLNDAELIKVRDVENTRHKYLQVLGKEYVFKITGRKKI